VPGRPVVTRHRRRRRRRAGTGEYKIDRGQKRVKDETKAPRTGTTVYVYARVPLPGPEGIRNPGSRVPLFSFLFPVVPSGQVNLIVREEVGRN